MTGSGAAEPTVPPPPPPVRVHHRLWRIVRIGAPILVGLATIGSLIVAWLQLQEQLRQIEAQTRRPPTFEARLDNPAATQRLVTFAADNDYQVRRIDLECLLDEGERSCVWADVGEKTETVLFISTRPNCPLSQNAGEATG